MSGWYAVFRKETANYFVSPIAYAVISIFLLLAGIFFVLYVMVMNEYSMQATGNPMIAMRINMTDMVARPLAGNMGIVLLFLMPLLTMRLFSEEKKSGCIELLLTYPITDMGVMLGKFLSAAFVLVVMLAATFSFPLIMFALGDPDRGTLAASYLGLLLMGLAFTALGMFISTLTENQIVAAAISFATSLTFWILSWGASFTDEQTGTVLRQMSVLDHLNPFFKGIVSLSDISFFLLFTAFFIFLTLRSVEAYRWRG